MTTECVYKPRLLKKKFFENGIFSFERTLLSSTLKTSFNGGYATNVFKELSTLYMNIGDTFVPINNSIIECLNSDIKRRQNGNFNF